MKEFIITITNSRDPLRISAYNHLLGSQYDNKEQKLMFERPEDRLDDDLILFFSTPSTDFSLRNIGKSNEFVITNALTQSRSLWLQIGFTDGDRIGRSNKIEFELEPSLPEGKAPVEPWPNPVLGLTSNAIANLDYTDNILSGRNLAGDEVASVLIEGGGVLQDYVDARDAATLAEAKAYTDEHAGSGGKGDPGADGKSAYDIAVENGFVGTEEEWLTDLRGTDGNNGFSPTISVEEQASDIYTLRITDADGSYLTPNLQGKTGGSGANGLTPYIGANGNWFVGDTDTGYTSRGGDGADGTDGHTPYIQNDYWYVNGVSTGINAAGTTGATGADGKAATIAVGTVTTVSPGTPASVVNVGTPSAAIFDIEIPRGADGAPGSGEGGDTVKSFFGTPEFPFFFEDIPLDTPVFLKGNADSKSYSKPYSAYNFGSEGVLGVMNDDPSQIDTLGEAGWLFTGIQKNNVMRYTIPKEFILGGVEPLPIKLDSVVTYTSYGKIERPTSFGQYPPSTTGAPISNNHLTNKAYVDNAISQIGTGGEPGGGTGGGMTLLYSSEESSFNWDSYLEIPLPKPLKEYAHVKVVVSHPEFSYGSYAELMVTVGEAAGKIISANLRNPWDAVWVSDFIPLSYSLMGRNPAVFTLDLYCEGLMDNYGTITYQSRAIEYISDIWYDHSYEYFIGALPRSCGDEESLRIGILDGEITCAVRVYAEDRL